MDRPVFYELAVQAYAEQVSGTFVRYAAVTPFQGASEAYDCPAFPYSRAYSAYLYLRWSWPLLKSSQAQSWAGLIDLIAQYYVECQNCGEWCDRRRQHDCEPDLSQW